MLKLQNVKQVMLLKDYTAIIIRGEVWGGKNIEGECGPKGGSADTHKTVSCKIIK